MYPRAVVIVPVLYLRGILDFSGLSRCYFYYNGKFYDGFLGFNESGSNKT